MGRVVIPGFRKIEISGGGEGGTTNYNDLTNKPSINNVPLTGNLNTADLNLTDATLTEEGVPAESKAVGEKFGEILQQFTTIGFETGPCTLTFGKFNETPGTLVESCEVTGLYIKVGKICFISLSNVLLNFEKTHSTTGVVIITGGIPYRAADYNNIIGYLSVGYPIASKNLIKYWREEDSLSAPPQFENLLKISGEMVVCLAVIYEIAD